MNDRTPNRTNLPVPVPARIPARHEGNRSLTVRDAGAGLALTGAAVVAGLGLRLLSKGIRALGSTPSSALTTQAHRLLRRRSEAKPPVETTAAGEPNFWVYGWRRSYTRWPDGSTQVQVEEIHRRGHL